MKKTIVTIIFIVNVCAAFGNNALKPVIVLRQTGYWAKFNGPEIVLYSNRTVIYREKNSEYYTARLSSKEYLKFINIIDFKYLNTFEPDSADDGIIDATWTTLIIWNNDAEKRILLRGSIESLTSKKNIDLSTELKSILLLLKTFTKINSVKWIPETIEVNLWSVNHPNHPKIKYLAWPNEWPDTLSNNSKRRSIWSEPYYSIYLPNKYWQDFKIIWKRIKRSKKTYLFKMNGLTWQPQYRFPFPNENTWSEQW